MSGGLMSGGPMSARLMSASGLMSGGLATGWIMSVINWLAEHYYIGKLLCACFCS